jgi:hypothetical protein
VTEFRAFYAEHGTWDSEHWVDWDLPELDRIVHLHLKQDASTWQVEHCYGILDDGLHVDVSLPFRSLPKGTNLKGEIIGHARVSEILADSLGLFDEGVIVLEEEYAIDEPYIP